MNKWMKVGLISLAGIAAIVTGGAVAHFIHGEDDHAVLACEIAIKARLKSPKSYERVEVMLNNNIVGIRYDAVNSFNAPIRDEKICLFEVDDDGNFTFSSNAKAIFDGKMAELNSRLSQFQKNGSTEKQRAALKAEGEAALTEMNDKTFAVMQDILSVVDIDWYPISPKKTRLKSAP